MMTEVRNLANRIVVSVHILTYNQENWIGYTIESILAQQTECTYEIIIGDDCSTDRTHEVCQSYIDKYPDIIRFAPQDHNLGVVGNYINCMKQSCGKYSMGCAGDDFWHNPNKLQLQVDYMEQHPECILLHTDYDELNSKTGKLKHNMHKGVVVPTGMIQNTILSGNAHINAPTVCLRLDAFKKYVPMDKFVELNFP